MAEFLGVGLGRDEMALAVIDKRKDHLKVVRLETVAYGAGAGDLGARAAAAAQEASRMGLPKSAVAVAIPGEEVFLQVQSVPFAKRSHIARTLAFEMEDKLPFEVEGAVLDFSVIATEGPNSRILVAALRRSVLESVVAPFAAEGFKVGLVTCEALAAGALTLLSPRAQYALLDVGSAGRRLAICDGGRLVFARAAPAVPSETAIETTLAAWFRQSLSAAPLGASPSEVVLSGSAAGSVDAQVLSTLVELPVEVLDGCDALSEAATSGEGTGSAAAASAALVAALALLRGGAEMDLLSAAKGRRRLAEVLFRPVAAALALIAVVGGVLTWGYELQKDAANARISAVFEAQRDMWNSIFPDTEAPANVHWALEVAVRELEETSGRDAIASNCSWFLRALYVLSVSLPADNRPTFKKFDVKPNRLTINVSTTETTATDKYRIAENIGEEGSFSAEITEVVAGSGGQTTYNIVIAPREAVQ